MLAKSKHFGQALYNSFFTSPATFSSSSSSGGADKPLPALLHSDVVKLISSIANAFPEIVEVRSIGKSVEKRDILMLEIDARSYLVKERAKGKSAAAEEELNLHYHNKPAIFITGQIHAREVITSSMVLYSVLRMLHGDILH